MKKTMNADCMMKKQTLLSALEVLDMISSRQTTPTAGFVKVTPQEKSVRFQLTAEVSGYVDVKPSGPWPFEEAIYLDRKIFFCFILAAQAIKSKADFQIGRIKNSISITNGTRHMKLACGAEVNGYLDAPTGGVTIPVDASIISMLQRGREYATQQEWSMAELETVMMASESDGLAFYSTTGMLSFRGCIESEVKLVKPVPIPPMLIELMKNKSLQSIQVTAKDVVLIFKHGKMWQELNQLAKNKFPLSKLSETVGHLRKTSKPCFTVYSSRLATALSRLTNYLGTVCKADWVLNLKAAEQDGSQLSLLVDIGGARFHERLLLKSPATKDVDIDWPLDKVAGLLIDIAEKGLVLQVSFDGKGRAYLRAGSQIEMLVPRRVR